VAAPHPSYPLRGRKNGLRAVFSPFGVFAAQKLQVLETAGIHAGHPCGFSPFEVCASRKLQELVTAGILPAHPVIFGLGVFAQQKPQEMETAGVHASMAFCPSGGLVVYKVNADALGMNSGSRGREKFPPA
jgi:hypothetical protein